MPLIIAPLENATKRLVVKDIPKFLAEIEFLVKKLQEGVAQLAQNGEG